MRDGQHTTLVPVWEGCLLGSLQLLAQSSALRYGGDQLERRTFLAVCRYCYGWNLLSGPFEISLQWLYKRTSRLCRLASTDDVILLCWGRIELESHNPTELLPTNTNTLGLFSDYSVSYGINQQCGLRHERPVT
jgi:hypothetical protein